MSGMFLLIVLCRTGEGMTLLFLDCTDSNGNHHQTANHAYSALMFQQNIRDEGKPKHPHTCVKDVCCRGTNPGQKTCKCTLGQHPLYG